MGWMPFPLPNQSLIRHKTEHNFGSKVGKYFGMYIIRLFICRQLLPYSYW